MGGTSAAGTCIVCDAVNLIRCVFAVNLIRCVCFNNWTGVSRFGRVAWCLLSDLLWKKCGMILKAFESLEVCLLLQKPLSPWSFFTSSCNYAILLLNALHWHLICGTRHRACFSWSPQAEQWKSCTMPAWSCLIFCVDKCSNKLTLLCSHSHVHRNMLSVGVKFNRRLWQG